MSELVHGGAEQARRRVRSKEITANRERPAEAGAEEEEEGTAEVEATASAEA